MSGIRTLADLRDRCIVDADSGCWRWSGAVSGKTPRVWFRGRSMTGARVAWALSRRKLMPGQTVYRTCCGGDSCIAPKHGKAGTKAEAGAFIRERGHLRGDPRRAAANRRNARTTSRFSPELRLVILTSTEPATKLGPKLGVHHSTVSLVRAGKRWTDPPGSSVFALPWKAAA